jgi:Holliday junction resolvase-like predicted endonuclease
LIVECNLIIAILKLTRDGCVLLEDVKKEARVPSNIFMNLLRKLQTDDLLKLNGSSVKVDGQSRLRLAVKAVSLGVDVEVVSGFLHWQEFESIAATVLQNNEFIVRQNLRFKHAARRWEIDVVGCRKRLVVCVDCKDWHHGLSPSAMRRIVEAQVERVKALADALPSVSVGLECVKWDKAKLIPVVLVLMPSRFKFCDGVPVVPVLQLQDFLYQLSVEVESLKYFQKDFVHLSQNFQERGFGELKGWKQA